MVTMNELLEEGAKTEDNEDYTCPGCNQKGHSEMTYKLFRLPQILVIHFVRFKESFNDDGSNFHVKDNTKVQFEKKGMSLMVAHSDDMSDEIQSTMYDLSGIILHEGDQHVGHYTAQSLDWNTNEWYEYNDEIVKKITGPDLLGNKPYILFYVRRDHK